MKTSDILTWVIGLLATALAVYFFFWKYKEITPGQAHGDPKYLWFAIGCTVVAFLCALVFFVRRVNKEEEIHITQ
jgi:amino acid permease